MIVGTDGSRRAQLAVPIAADAASAFDCPLETVHVRAAEDPDDLDLVGVRLVSADDPASGLIAFAAETDPPGLLCVATRGRGSLGEAVFGSVTSRILRDLHAPVLVVGPSVRRPDRPWRRLVVCLDGSDTAAEMLPVATEWAHALDLAVELLHVAYPLDDPRSGDFFIPEEEKSAAEQVRAATDTLIDAGVRATWSIIEHAHVAEGIAIHAARGLSSLIALATHGRSALAKLVAGSVACEVAQRATIPVLTMRPHLLR